MTRNLPVAVIALLLAACGEVASRTCPSSRTATTIRASGFRACRARGPAVSSGPDETDAGQRGPTQPGTGRPDLCAADGRSGSGWRLTGPSSLPTAAASSSCPRSWVASRDWRCGQTRQAQTIGQMLWKGKGVLSRRTPAAQHDQDRKLLKLVVDDPDALPKTDIQDARSSG